MCIHPSNQESPSSSSSSSEPTNTEPLNSEPQPNPSPEPASESRKRAMQEPYSPEPNPKPKHYGASSSDSTPSPPPPPPLITEEFTEAFVEDMLKYLTMPLEELNRQSPSLSTLPPPPPINDDLFMFLPASIFDEPEPLNTIDSHHEGNYPIPILDPFDDWTSPFASNIDEKISARADPIHTGEPTYADYVDPWDAPESNLRRRKASAVVSPSIGYVSIDHTDLPISTPGSRFVGAGIENLRNTCFMASVLQCLTHTGQMLTGIRSCYHDTSSCRRDGFCVICAFRDHNDRAIDPDRNPIRPEIFLRNVNQFSDNFVANNQEDAHEFLIGALNKLRSAFPEEGRHNLIEQIFGGKIVSQLRCCSCGFSSDTIDPILELGLAVDNAITVKRALDTYIKVENMDEMFKCSNCNQEVYMEKQLLIDKAPEIAVLHLKRFKKGRSSYGKIADHVYFTMKLDLEPYTSAKGRENLNLMYDLYAVVVHRGSTANSGHYFSYVRSDKDNWHLMDDAEVFSVSGEDVLAAQAYMLFYAKQGTAWFSSVLKTEEEALREKSIGNTQDSEATDSDSLYANDDDSMRANDSDSMYGFNSDSPNGNEKPASDMEEEECDLAGANDKYFKDADDNDSKATNEMSLSDMDGEDADLADANDKDSKDVNVKSVSGMDGEECDLADANDNDSKDANDIDSKDANEKSVSGMDGANDNDSKVVSVKSVSSMDGEECDLVDANDKDSKDANDDNDSKDANEKPVSGTDGEECDLADANDNDSKDANDINSKDGNEKSVSGMDGADDNDSKDAYDNDSKVVSVKSMSGMDGEECDLVDANDKDSKDANDDKDANEKPVSDTDGEECDLADANDNDSKDANDIDSKDANEKSVSGMDGADDNDSKDAYDTDSKVISVKSVSGMDGEECDLVDAKDEDSKDANDDKDSKDANDDNDSKDANDDNDSKIANDDKDSKDANYDKDSKDANEKSVSAMDGEECVMADANDSKDANEKPVSGTDGEECDLADANDNNDSRIANERLGSDMDEGDVIPPC